MEENLDEGIKKFTHLYNFVVEKMGNMESLRELIPDRLGRDNYATLDTICEYLISGNPRVPAHLATEESKTLIKGFMVVGYILKTEEQRYEISKTLGNTNG